MKPEIKIFENVDDLSNALAIEFQQSAKAAAQSDCAFHVALSGGTTPALFFKYLAEPTYQNKVPWEHVHFFWGDERCVPPDHPESNYGMTRRNLLNQIPLPQPNIHRIRAEENPFEEVNRYSEEIENTVPKNKTNWPQFDWIFLGLGNDGHTASIFPGSDVLTEGSNICALATHPISGQQRITLTLPVINNAKRISFLVSGESKAPIVAGILQDKEGSKLLPAAHVQPEDGILEWYMDRPAAALIQNKRGS